MRTENMSSCSGPNGENTKLLINDVSRTSRTPRELGPSDGEPHLSLYFIPEPT